MKKEFVMELQRLLNRESIDAYCNTPDFILADYLWKQIEAYREVVLRRERWCDRDPDVLVKLEVK